MRELRPPKISEKFFEHQCEKYLSEIDRIIKDVIDPIIPVSDKEFAIIWVTTEQQPR